MLTYTNPVYPEYLADPFVLRYDGRYYACGTGPTEDGRAFVVIHSPDLVHWEKAGGALDPVPGAVEYWAPEVAYDAESRLFYLYYSARGIDGRDHGLRVATSPTPLGPFADAGRWLAPEHPFSIDAHPFRDDDGAMYLFYSVDFLTLDDDQRVGTGIVVDRMADMLTLAGDPHTVVRPHTDWHLFRAGRAMYGEVFDWHTVEGAAVQKREGRYYCFYSGGAWEHDNYGISYVVADHPLGPYLRPANPEPILRSLPGRVVGPGHNSFTVAPDGKTVMCVYHAWDVGQTARRMCIDPLVWDEGGGEPMPRILGPSFTEQTLTFGV